MNKIHTYINNVLMLVAVVITIVTFTACSDDDGGGETPPSIDNRTINFDVTVDDETRAFIKNAQLPGKCSPADGLYPEENGDATERVGLATGLAFKADGLNPDGWYKTHREYMNMAMAYFQYGTEAERNWHYYTPVPVDKKDFVCDNSYWIGGTKMFCVAYYPNKFIRSKKMIGSQPTALAFNISYKTLEVQEDVVVGYNIVDSDTRKDMSDTEIANKTTVPITMEHIVAAIKFQFKRPVGEVEDRLTGCWLKTGDAIPNQNNIALTGTMQCNPKIVDGKDVMKMSWTNEYSKATNETYYEWKTAAPIVIPESGTPAVSHTGTNSISNNQMYCNHDGFIFVVPQDIPHNLSLVFTTKNGGVGNEVPRLLYQPDNAAMPTKWEPGKRYTYTITLSKAGLSWEVDVTDWNNIKSNTSIDF